MKVFWTEVWSGEWDGKAVTFQSEAGDGNGLMIFEPLIFVKTRWQALMADGSQFKTNQKL